MARTFLTLIFATTLVTILTASEKPRNNYIDKYKDIAIVEKQRSGIPVAITLGQGIFESGWGEAMLATTANNHFGIKCGSSWNGPTFAQKDDDYDMEGTLIQSCFRQYDSAENSFVDHTNFLMSGSRYSALFTIQQDNYREWAFGLQSAGYATDPQYAEKLISIIERFQLYKYDGLDHALTPTTDFNENKFEKKITGNKEYIPLQDGEIFEIGAGEVLLENIKYQAKTTEPAAKSMTLPKDYQPTLKKKFDGFFKKPKSVASDNIDNLE
jgi:hypothetical protein